MEIEFHLVLESVIRFGWMDRLRSWLLYGSRKSPERLQRFSFVRAGRRCPFYITRVTSASRRCDEIP